MAYSVDPDETARDEPSHLDLYTVCKVICFDLQGLKDVTSNVRP